MRKIPPQDVYFLGLLLTYAVFMVPVIVWGIPFLREQLPTLDPISVWAMGLSYAFASVYIGVLLYTAAGIPYDLEDIKWQTWRARILVFVATCAILYANPVRLYNTDGTPRGLYAPSERKVYFYDPEKCLHPEKHPAGCFSPVTGEKLVPIPQEQLPEIIRQLEENSLMFQIKKHFSKVVRSWKDT